MKTRLISVCIAVIAVFAAVSVTQFALQGSQEKNSVKKEWKSLFDGRSTTGWRGFGRKDFPSVCWAVEEGCLKRLTGPQIRREDCGDIITTGQFDNFILELEWRISPRGNSGIKYLVPENRPAGWERASADYQIAEVKRGGRPGWEKEIAELTPARWQNSAIGFELQLIDDAQHPDARRGSTRITGALYDLLSPSASTSRGAGQFNRARIVVRGDHVEHWINETKVLEFQRGSRDLLDAIGRSKFKQLEGFGLTRRGHIALQDHDDNVWFRNIRILELSGS
jgi:hypothetical protein